MPFQPTARAAGTSVLAARYQAIDLSTGFPNTNDPAAVKAVVVAALEAGRNQYALSHGVGELRQAVAGHIQRFYRQSVNPETKITITPGLLHIVGGPITKPNVITYLAAGLCEAGFEVSLFRWALILLWPGSSPLALTTISPAVNTWPLKWGWRQFPYRPFIRPKTKRLVRTTCILPFAKHMKMLE